MSKATTTLSILLTIMLIGFGLVKLSPPIASPNDGMAWTLEFEEWQVQALGLLELLAAIGVIAPLILKRWYGLAKLALVGIVVLMLGAIGTHVSIDDPVAKMIPAIVVLVVVSGLLWLRLPSRRGR